MVTYEGVFAYTIVIIEIIRLCVTLCKRNKK